MVLARYGDSTDPKDAELLGESIVMPFSGKVAKTRFLKTALAERMSSWDQYDTSKRGIPSDSYIRLYEEWGKGGWGMIITGNVAVHPDYVVGAGDAVLYAPNETKEHIEQFRKAAAAGKAHGSPMLMQISHAGRQVPITINPHPLGASDIQLGHGMDSKHGKPTALSIEGIKEIVHQFAHVAEVAYQTGYDGVQVHGAHGFLVSQFLSASTNNRTDEYGGSNHNRARFLREIVTAIRDRVSNPRFMIGVKINSTEFQANTANPADAAELCKELEEMKVDFVELTGGSSEKWAGTNYIPRASTKRRESFFTEFAEAILPQLNKIVPYVTGGFRSAAGMADAVRAGSCVGIGLGQPATSDPYLPNEVLSGRVPGATVNRLPPGSYYLQVAASGSQEESIARGIPIFDLSDQGVADEYI
ncbi:unnamed protein product, partial [Rhizoctonia solani]